MATRPPALATAALVAALAVTMVACTGTGAAPSASSGVSPSADTSASAPAAADVTVTAVDFGYEGVPAEVPSGTTLGLTNTGQEVHEMVVVRKLPTTTQSFEELLAMPQDQALGLVQDVGFAFAEPGKTSTDVVTTGEPGAYLMVCFIPAGTTSLPSMDPNSSEEPSLGTGAPHFTLGMTKEFTVTE